jgi:transposase-like zinc-binding protein/putative transposase
MTRPDVRPHRPAIEIADILRRHGDAYRRDHAGHLGRVERRVMSAIVACRTEALGGHVEACNDCGMTRIAYNSCRNRHCPKCQGRARAAWLAAREADLLPVPYFHVVFTLPAPIAAIAFQNKAVVYAILFKAAAEAMTTLAANPRRLGAEIGGVAVLHTWGQALTHHPHIHCVVPGGGLSYQPSEELTDDGPVAGRDRGDAPGFGEKFSPGVLAGVEDVGVGREHTVGEIGLSQILPDVLGCVELRTGGWQRHEGDIGRWL